MALCLRSDEALLVYNRKGRRSSYRAARTLCHRTILSCDFYTLL
jgi:hypothetical protein